MLLPPDRGESQIGHLRKDTTDSDCKSGQVSPPRIDC